MLSNITNLNKIVILILFLALFACSSQDEIGQENNENNIVQINVAPEGFSDTLEIATWNIRNFPLASNTTEKLEVIIPQLDIDLYAVQEIEDKDEFKKLTDKMEKYDGFLSSHTYSSGEYQKTGIIYKKDIVSILSSELLFSDDNYAFPRPPLLLHLNTASNGKNFDFYLIIIHLKAFSGQENVDRRKAAALKLKNYIDEKINNPNETEKDYIIAGDWNDLIDEVPEDNAFQVFLDASNSYRFLTDSLLGIDENASYPSWSELIDHILISGDAFFEYSGGSIKTLRLDDQISDYSSTISDHRPVMAIFPVF